ncbi:MAG: GYD domain-containing protein [Acidimicrobiia bacterium]|nr:GYD domain-containing protein [Acidimicrobiia bacterium]
MPTFVTLINYTEQGIRSFKDSGQRLDAARQLIESMGGRWLGFYLTMGPYDAVVVTEGPDDETAAKVSLIIGGQGNVRTTTMRAFAEDEAKRIASELP